ncbi:PSD1 and planctomycete cytochrome C domain-containing protein [Lignipirellula cremea]|uniref:Planctomycete cytochrome C n=1 Tax=Lignipirellula cremea TaxID=2528010 RepID=A0A518E0Z4_9BACT|nr:PSD1 and planctomycete cytochrome C domain-containing protein [Lignipirellula cremea]QDU97769.1 Planctomycete cytochrome C [Lignipirellula cremea]
MKKRLALVACGWFACSWILANGMLPVMAAETVSPAEQAEQLAFFEKRVRPLLLQRCAECHGAEAQEGKLRLDSPAGIRQGGASGAVVIAGKPEQSLLIAAISHRNEELQMPPETKLPAGEIADLTAWVARGAVLPGERLAAAPARIDLDQARQYWAFQPIVRPPVPTVHQQDWPLSPIDHFILARLEAAGLQPSPPADKRTLLRRATFDLTGLPPTQTELTDFLADDSPDAFAKVVDRLLESPAYGERWGRHWLDVARYADSNGLDENVAHGNAWRYRDYVIDALNDDKPYDQFVREQLAGDLLPTDDRDLRNERLTATGFLTLGPKVLAEVDAQKMEMDIVDEQIDTVGRAFLGLTFGCARCHDHKFDPLLASDYYALAGIFQSTRSMETFKKIARWQENEVPTDAELQARQTHAAQIEKQQQAIDAIVAAARESTAAGVNDESSPGQAEAAQADPESAFPPAVQAALKEQRASLTALRAKAPALSTAMGVIEGPIQDTAVHLRGSHLTLGPIIPRRFPLVLAGEDQPPLPADASGRLQLARWLASPDHPLTARVIVNRVWRWRFGAGLVRSTDNFGQLGERPSHPELLDWLAASLPENGWSLKQLHRQMMLTRVYQMAGPMTAGQGDVQPENVDPENRLLHHFPLRRLEAEELRDALLAVSGRLDRTAGGSLLTVANRKHVFDHTSIDRTRYDSDRRSVYLPVIRNNLYDLFQLFDYTDAGVVSGDRATSTVAPQALFLMNSPWVRELAGALQARLLAETPVENLSPDAVEQARLRQLYLLTLQREPRPAETLRAVRFLDQWEQLATASEATKAEEPTSEETATPEETAASFRDQAWRALCQGVLLSNEFATVR